MKIDYALGTGIMNLCGAIISFRNSIQSFFLFWKFGFLCLSFLCFLELQLSFLSSLVFSVSLSSLTSLLTEFHIRRKRKNIIHALF